MKDALLIGYYGQRNTGDDAFLAVTAWGAQRALGARHMWATATHLPVCYGAPVRPLYVGGISRLRDPLDRWAAAHSRCLIFGGGSNFHSTYRLRQRLALVERCAPGPRVALGVSIGPFRDPEAEAACAALLQRLDFVGLRDEVSYQRVRDLAPDTAAELTFDLAVQLGEVTGQAPAAPSARRGLGVALCNHERFTGGDTEREARRVRLVAQALRALHRRQPLDEIVLLDFNGHRRLGDAPVHAALARELEGLPVRQVPYSPDSAAVLNRVAGLRGLLAMRLHAAVFAFCAQTPCVMLAYHEKCRGWAGLTGQPEALVCDTSALDPERLQAALETALADAPPGPSLSLAEAQRRAGRNWQALAELAPRSGGTSEKR